MFGLASGSFGSSSALRNASNSSHNIFASVALPSTTSPSFSTQGSVFGGSSTGVFAPRPTSTASTPTYVFGQPSGAFGPSSAFGNTSNLSHNLCASNSSGSTIPPSFSFPTQGSSFGGSSTGVFGKTSGTFGSSSAFGNTSNSSHNLCASNSSGSTISPSFSFLTQGSGLSGNSTGVFGEPWSSSPASTSPFCTNISAPKVWPFSCGSITASSPFTFGTASNFPSGKNLQPVQTQPSTFGGKITSYTPTVTKEGEKTCKLISISAMPIFGSKSHEELRWETYELKSGGQHNSGSNIHEIGSTVNKQHSTFSFPSLTSPLGPLSPPFTGSVESRIPSLFTPQVPVLTAPSPLTSLNRSNFQIPHFSSPAPSPNFIPLNTKAPALKASESAPIQREGSILHPAFNNPSLQISKSLAQPVGLQSPHALGVTPNAPATQIPSAMLAYDQFSMSNTLEQPRVLQTPSTGTGLGQTIPAQSASTTPAFSTGDNVGGSLYLGQPSLLQQHATTDKDTYSIIAVKDPFGSQPTASQSQPSIGHLASSSLIQHGISSMPVLDKPSKPRVSSFLTSRRLSLRPVSVNLRKYHPKTDGSEVPFFYHTEETQNTSKAYNCLIPRENPRSVFSISTELPHVTASKEEKSQQNYASELLYDNGGEDSKRDQISCSKPSSFALCEAYDTPKQVKDLVNANRIDTKPLIPKLKRSDYYSVPEMEELASIESLKPGLCSRVKDFVVGRHGYGWVKFDGETDVCGLNLDTLVHFNNREVVVYMDESEKPPVGQGLNKAAEVTLLNIKCTDKTTGKEYSGGKMVDKYVDKLKKVAE